MMKIPALEDCKERFKKFGVCECHHREEVIPYGCDVAIMTCKVCAKHHGKRYL